MDTPLADELLKKIQVLETGQANLKKEMTKLRHSEDVKSKHQRAHSVSPQHLRFSSVPRRRVTGGGGAAGNRGHDVAAWKRWRVRERKEEIQQTRKGKPSKDAINF
ncbi:hypothetical protein ACFX2H_013094 [Malus domestica]